MQMCGAYCLLQYKVLTVNEHFTSFITRISYKIQILKETNLTLVIFDFPASIVRTPLELSLFHWWPDPTNYLFSNKQTWCSCWVIPSLSPENKIWNKLVIKGNMLLDSWCWSNQYFTEITCSKFLWSSSTFFWRAAFTCVSSECLSSCCDKSNKVATCQNYHIVHISTFSVETVN